jgi:hypothetical protein
MIFYASSLDPHSDAAAKESALFTAESTLAKSGVRDPVRNLGQTCAICVNFYFRRGDLHCASIAGLTRRNFSRGLPVSGQLLSQFCWLTMAATRAVAAIAMMLQQIVFILLSFSFEGAVFSCGDSIAPLSTCATNPNGKSEAEWGTTHSQHPTVFLSSAAVNGWQYIY